MTTFLSGPQYAGALLETGDSITVEHVADDVWLLHGPYEYDTQIVLTFRAAQGLPIIDMLTLPRQRKFDEYPTVPGIDDGTTSLMPTLDGLPYIRQRCGEWLPEQRAVVFMYGGNSYVGDVGTWAKWAFLQAVGVSAAGALSIGDAVTLNESSLAGLTVQRCGQLMHSEGTFGGTGNVVTHALDVFGAAVSVGPRIDHFAEPGGWHPTNLVKLPSGRLLAVDPPVGLRELGPGGTVDAYDLSYRRDGALMHGRYVGSPRDGSPVVVDIQGGVASALLLGPGDAVLDVIHGSRFSVAANADTLVLVHHGPNDPGGSTDPRTNPVWTGTSAWTRVADGFTGFPDGTSTSPFLSDPIRNTGLVGLTADGELMVGMPGLADSGGETGAS